VLQARHQLLRNLVQAIQQQLSAPDVTGVTPVKKRRGKKAE
jgi:hypothetical protein